MSCCCTLLVLVQHWMKSRMKVHVVQKRASTSCVLRRTHWRDAHCFFPLPFHCNTLSPSDSHPSTLVSRPPLCPSPALDHCQKTASAGAASVRYITKVVLLGYKGPFGWWDSRHVTFCDDTQKWLEWTARRPQTTPWQDWWIARLTAEKK